MNAHECTAFNKVKGPLRERPHLEESCNAPSGALDGPTWTREVTQGNHEGSRFQGKGKGVEHRGLLRDWDDTRSSPHPSVVALGCSGWRRREGRRTGLLLEATRPRARYGYRV
jgi:hypothetical protein